MSRPPLRLLFVCTGNSARSQIAEAVLNAEAGGRVVAESAGVEPAARVNPLAVRVLEEYGYASPGHAPRGLDVAATREWDCVVTVCDHARESCPLLPGRPAVAHWGMPDPAAVGGSDAVRRAAFEAAFRVIRGRVRRLLALSPERLSRGELAQQVDAIAREPSGPTSAGEHRAG
ncbi:MAG TPA: arsenate reductase ArsC [Gemmatimonadales bacterium]|nr:arsenate reductase ArsC [Gemmatimonadales bacterium]